MKHFCKPGLAAAGFVFCLVSPAMAQIGKNPVGAINATIDGETYAGETLDVPSEGNPSEPPMRNADDRTRMLRMRGNSSG